MSKKTNRRRAMLSWLFVIALLVLCGVLGFLQYRWIGEVTVAARERLRGGLQASLNRFSREFNSEISTAMWALAPANAMPNAESVETAVARNYQEWRQSSRHNQMFSRIGIVELQEGGVTLHTLDLATGAFQKADWPASWKTVRERLNARIEGLGPRRALSDDVPDRDGAVWEIPIFGNGPELGGGFRRPGFPGGRGPGERGFGPPRGGGPGRFGPPPDRPPDSGGPPGGGRRSGGPDGPRRFPEIVWLVFELNVPYVHDAVLPDLLQRDLADYQVEVVTRTQPAVMIYQSEPDGKKRIEGSADGSVNLFAPPYDSRAAGRGPGPNPASGPGAQQGRWEMLVRHRAGSLETVVAGVRRRDLGVTAGVLALLLASVAALVRYTRQAQSLAQVQMDFVAGISHELRTPLTVIHTAGYNLQGKMAQNPAQVERYGKLIHQESARLTELVEQILRFAGTEAGSIIREPEPLSIEEVIHDTVESSRPAIEQAHCVIEETIDDGLPMVLGDATALRHALQNLLANAAKYGTKGSNWIGIFASRACERGRTMVEIRVADRGPGIPPEEQKHIFDPFFRGQRAMEDQVHGTGLGLNLVKKIVEAHGGTIRVKSEPMKGAEFIIRIPEAAGGAAG